MDSSTEADRRIDDLERMALALIEQATELLSTALRLRELVKLEDQRSPAAHADGRSPR